MLTFPLDSRVRKYPYPFKSMLALCSDLDGTLDLSSYMDLMVFLNTKEETTMGQGIGLEVGNSIYFDNIPERFAYWTTDDQGRRWIESLIKSGHIDCLHSIGEKSTNREHARRAFAALQENNCQIEVWVNHGRTPTNFSSANMPGEADIVGSDAYHADLAMEHGIQFVWLGQVTTVPYQNTRPTLFNTLIWEHPLASLKTIAKQTAKLTLGAIGVDRYRMHWVNSLLRPTKLADGSNVHEFIRSNPHWEGIHRDTGSDLDAVLTDKLLSAMVRQQGTSIIYSHFLKYADQRKLPTRVVEAFRRLARFADEGSILVTTTRRVLGYWRARSEVEVKYSQTENGGTKIDITSNRLAQDQDIVSHELAGMTFYTENPDNVSVWINGVGFSDLIHNPPDETSRRSVSIPWKRLSFPETITAS